jgi:arabinofuranosyltransferase
LNRMDTLLLYLPALAWALREIPRKQAARLLAIGFSPFLAWELFSLFYYGFLFPNTAYAKLATGVPRTDLIEQGFYYFLNSLSVDPVTLVAIAAAALLAWKGRQLGELALVAGVGLYLAYTLWIGGDFMGGRFFSAPLVVGALILSRWKTDLAGMSSLLPFLIVGVVGLSTPFAPLLSDSHYARHRQVAADNARITDERAFYYEGTGLLRSSREFEMPNQKAAIEGRQAREQGAAVVVRGGVGMFGYHAGPSVHIIEPWAVCDPLLARLPVPAGAFWRIGHFRREIPDGYEQTQRSGTNKIADPQIAQLYDALEIVTRDPLFSGRRFTEIWKLNTGAYAD